MTHRTLRQVLRQEFLHQVLPIKDQMQHKEHHFHGYGCRAGDGRIFPCQYQKRFHQNLLELYFLG